jgi:hypothetical protein
MAMRPGTRAAGAARTGDPCCSARLVTGRFGHCADGYARHRFDFGDKVSGGDWRPLAVSIAVRTDGLSWPGAVRGFDRRLR